MDLLGVTASSVLGGVIGAIAKYKEVINANKAKSVSEAMANLARNSKFYENIAKEARKVALKYGIKKIGTFNLIFHSGIFLNGIYKGWKYYNDYKNRDVISFARHVYKKHGVFSWW